MMNPVIHKSLFSLEQGKVPNMEIFPRKSDFQSVGMETNPCLRAGAT